MGVRRRPRLARAAARLALRLRAARAWPGTCAPTRPSHARAGCPSEHRRLQFRNRLLMMVKNETRAGCAATCRASRPTRSLALGHALLRERHLLRGYGEAARLLRRALRRRRVVRAAVPPPRSPSGFSRPRTPPPRRAPRSGAGGVGPAPGRGWGSGAPGGFRRRHQPGQLARQGDVGGAVLEHLAQRGQLAGGHGGPAGQPRKRMLSRPFRRSGCAASRDKCRARTWRCTRTSSRPRTRSPAAA